MTSVIIPTRNAAKQIRGLLTALRSQTVQCEIIIVDSSSSDGTAEIAGLLGADVIVIKREDFDHGGTRNLGAARAKGNILVYMTQDAIPSDEYAVENLLMPFQDQTIAAAYGRQLPYPEASPFGAYLRLFNYPGVSFVKGIADKGKYKIKTPFLSNAFAAYRRSVLADIGGFRKRLIMGEDTCAGADLLLAGYKIAYVAEATVYHSHHYTVLQEFRRYFDIGVFHETERWILEKFGQAEGEGKRYVASELRYIARQRKYYLLPELLVRNCLKYAGYRLGRIHERIPRGIIKKISMHGEWWNGEKKEP